MSALTLQEITRVKELLLEVQKIGERGGDIFCLADYYVHPQKISGNEVVHMSDCDVYESIWRLLKNTAKHNNTSIEVVFGAFCRIGLETGVIKHPFSATQTPTKVAEPKVQLISLDD